MIAVVIQVLLLAYSINIIFLIAQAQAVDLLKEVIKRSKSGCRGLNVFDVFEVLGCVFV